MSQATKRKYVVKEVLGEFIEPSEIQQIVKIVASRGNNLHEVETASGERFLASMPTKFRKNVWVKRGDYVVTEPIEEGDRVKAEIAHILYRDNIRYLGSQGKWPEGFSKENVDEDEGKGVRGSDSDSESDLFVNTNRQPVQNYLGSSNESETDEDEQSDHDKESNG